MARPKRLIHCAECGCNRLHEAKGLCGQCYHRQYRETHSEEVKEAVRRWGKTNPDKRREYVHRWHEANPENHRESSRRYYKTHPGRVYERNRRWQKANPDKVREQTHRHRARKNGATIEPVDETAIYERDKVCIYCGAAENLELDHLTPLARGGAHTQDNLAVACRSCNARKHTKTYEEFRQGDT